MGKIIDETLQKKSEKNSFRENTYNTYKNNNYSGWEE